MEPPKSIKKLDEAVINRIAAGEIIQRPANALKELLENSLDAKSTSICVTVKNGGLKLLQIQDNGTGIRKDDFEIVCERFTTSKLSNFEDLSTIQTYGFRGEALASISHIAHLSITSKTAKEICAYQGQYVDGKLQGKLKPIAGNQGTIITVEDLFYNMNVRKQALRSPSEEYQKLSDVVSKYAIHNSGVAFALKKYGESENNDVRTNCDATIVDNIRTIYGNKIARELVNFSLSNDQLGFKAEGYLTNVNFSTKKLIFLLFINHRLVDCQSLKKSIDQVYSTYLPKNSHPFVYCSLEVNPKNVDVNVHPTKHEVNFLNEELIVETLAKHLECKLLGSDNSRVFYTQAKLPGAPIEPKIISKNDDDKKIYAKDLVRTDPKLQKLETFFGAPVKKSETDKNKEENQEKIKKSSDDVIEIVEPTPPSEKVTKKENKKSKKKPPLNLNTSLTEEEYQKRHEDFIKKGEKFETCLLNDTVEKVEEISVIEHDTSKNAVFSARTNRSLSNFTRVETKLTSIRELCKSIEKSCHQTLRETFAQHVFVGIIDPSKALIQYSTKLYLCNTETLLQELFYQYIIFNFENLGLINLSESIPVYEIAMLGLDLPETGWTEEDGPKEELARRIVSILKENSEMLEVYFSLKIDEDGNLLSLPLLLDNFFPNIAKLPMYIVRLATEVTWNSEKECFDTFARETALFYCQVSENTKFEDQDWKWVIEHVCYRGIKQYFIPPKEFTQNAAILEIANLPNLYKTFERC